MDFIWKVSAKAKEVLVLKEEGKKAEGEANANDAPSNESDIPASSIAGGETLQENVDDRSDKSSTPEYDEKEGKEKEEQLETEETPGEKTDQPAPASSSLPKAPEHIKEVSFKAVEQARSFGSFLYGVANRTKSSISETAKHLKSTVEQNSILGDFNKEHEAFLSNRTPKSSDAGLPPWVGCEDEENIKQQILSLSSDKRNFLRSPPSGVLFEFNFDAMHPVATVMLKEDPSLEKMRFELVPKLVSEENFWRNYFYRVSLLKQSTRLTSMSHQKSAGDESASSIAKRNSTDENAKDDDWEKELQKELELQEYEVVAESNSGEYLLDSDMLESEIDQILGKDKVKDIV